MNVLPNFAPACELGVSVCIILAVLLFLNVIQMSFIPMLLFLACKAKELDETIIKVGICDTLITSFLQYPRAQSILEATLRSMDRAGHEYIDALSLSSNKTYIDSLESKLFPSCESCLYIILEAVEASVRELAHVCMYCVDALIDSGDICAQEPARDPTVAYSSDVRCATTSPGTSLARFPHQQRLGHLP